MRVCKRLRSAKGATPSARLLSLIGFRWIAGLALAAQPRSDVPSNSDAPQFENPDAADKRNEIEDWLATIEKGQASRTLFFDRPAAYALGKLLISKPQDKKMLDALLAAQAIAHDCPIATRNVKDFEWTGVKLINPWEA